MNHVMTALFIGLPLLVAFVQFVRKAFSDTVEYPDGRGSEKHGSGYLRKFSRKN